MAMQVLCWATGSWNAEGWTGPCGATSEPCSSQNQTPLPWTDLVPTPATLAFRWDQETVLTSGKYFKTRVQVTCTSFVLCLIHPFIHSPIHPSFVHHLSIHPSSIHLFICHPPIHPQLSIHHSLSRYLFGTYYVLSIITRPKGQSQF